jgi:hypothetical protein
VLALELHKFPAEIDAQPAVDIWAIQGVLAEREAIKQEAREKLTAL